MASRKLRIFNRSSPLFELFKCEHAASAQSQHHHPDHHRAFQAGQVRRLLHGVRVLRSVGALRLAGVRVVLFIAVRSFGFLRGFLAPEDGGVGHHGTVGLGHLAGIAGADGVAGSVPAAGGPGIAGGGGVPGDGVALAVHIGGLAPLHIPQGQGLALVLDALGDEGGIRFGQVGIAAAGGEGAGLGGVAVRGHLDAGVVQPKDAHIAVLGGHLHLRVQPLEDGLQVIGIAGLGDGFCMSLDVHAYLVLPGHVQQVIPSAIADKVLRRDEAGIVRQRELIGLVDPQLVKVAVGVLLHGHGVIAGALARFRFRRQGGGAPGHDEGKGAQDGENAFHGIFLRFFVFFSLDDELSGSGLTASSQAPYPSSRRKRQDSLTSLLLLFPRHPLRWAAVGALFPPFSGPAAQL